MIRALKTTINQTKLIAVLASVCSMLGFTVTAQAQKTNVALSKPDSVKKLVDLTLRNASLCWHRRAISFAARDQRHKSRPGRG